LPRYVKLMYIMNESRLFELQSEAQDRHDGHRFEHYLNRSKKRAELIEVTVQDMAGFFMSSFTTA